MRAIPMMSPPPGAGASLEAKVDWLMTIVPQIVQATQDDPETIADDYRISRLSDVPVRTLNVDGATAADVAAVLGSFLIDWQRRGTNRGTG